MNTWGYFHINISLFFSTEISSSMKWHSWFNTTFSLMEICFIYWYLIVEILQKYNWPSTIQIHSCIKLMLSIIVQVQSSWHHTISTNNCAQNWCCSAYSCSSVGQMTSYNLNCAPQIPHWNCWLFLTAYITCSVFSYGVLWLTMLHIIHSYC